LLILLKER